MMVTTDLYDVERRVLSTLWSSPILLNQYPELSEAYFSPPLRPIFTLIRECYRSGATPLVSLLPAEYQELAAEVVDTTAPVDTETLRFLVEVLAQARLRELLRQHLKSSLQLLDYDDPIQVLGRLTREVLALSQHVGASALTLASLLEKLLVWLERGVAQEQVGLWGLDELDRDVLGGLRAGTLVVVAAPTGAGKTSLAVQIACASATGGYPVAFFSLEMGEIQLAARVASHLLRVDTSILYKGVREALPEDFRERVAALAGQPLPIYFSDRGWDVVQLEGSVLHFLAKHGTRLVIVDYLQKVGVPLSRRSDTREFEVGEVARNLKRMAVQQGICVVALSQVNNEREFRTRESRAVEHEADVVVRLRPEDSDVVALEVWKNRMGPTRTIRYQFLRSQARFGDVSTAGEGWDSDEFVF